MFGMRVITDAFGNVLDAYADDVVSLRKPLGPIIAAHAARIEREHADAERVELNPDPMIGYAYTERLVSVRNADDAETVHAWRAVTRDGLYGPCDAWCPRSEGGRCLVH